MGGDFQSGDRFEVNVQRFMDAPTDTFEIFNGVTVAPGRYWWNSGYTTDPSSRYRFPDRRALSRPLNGALVVKAVHRFVP